MEPIVIYWEALKLAEMRHDGAGGGGADIRNFFLRHFQNVGMCERVGGLRVKGPKCCSISTSRQHLNIVLSLGD